MIQQIKNEIELALENIINCENNNSDRHRMTYYIERLLDIHMSQNNIYNYKVICNEENNTINKKHINIDIYIQEHIMYKIMHLNFIYNGNKIAALQKLRKNKLEKICTLSTI